MPDIASLGIELNSKQVVEGTRALDGLATAATAVEPKVNQVTKAADDLSAASAKVWRYGTDAAKSVEALGEATQRTGQRTQVSNGQMNDTAKILQFQAEQAKATAAANVALGASSNQASIGAQIFIDKLKEQVAVLGMSRSQLAAYQAAQLGVSREAEASIAKLKAYEEAIKSVADAKAAAAKQSNILLDAVKLLSAGYGALKVGEYIKDASLMAARYETLGVVVEVVGRNAGYTKTQMDTATDAIARQGITMIESRESATKLVQAHVDLKNATVLARIAQDAAVIGHLNSSDAFDRLVNGISRGNVLILRNIGINVNLQSAYQDMARELGKSTKELTENERVQARLNAVIERGADIAGTYTAAMDTAGKQITSMQRYTQDLKTKIGEVFNESLTVGVMALTAGLKDANGEVSELSRNNQLHEWGHSLTTIFVGVANAVDNILTGVKKAGTWAAHFNASNDIDAKFYDRQRTTPDEKIPALRREWQQALTDEQRMYEESQTTLGATYDRFQRAFDERSAAQLEKRKKEADAKLKVDQDYAKAATALMIANADKSVEIQQKAQLALAKSVYVGTPNYRDSEGREPKPKVDRAENTALADKIKGFEKDAAATKAHYDALGRLDDMYLKAGELSVQKSYENKRSYALATYEAQIDAFDQEADALGAHNSKTKAEAATHAKELNEINAKRAAAEQTYFADSFRRDEEERIRKDGIIKASEDADLKEIASINAQVAAVEMQIRTYGMLPAAKTAVLIADLEMEKSARIAFDNDAKAVALIDAKIEALGRLKGAQTAAAAQEAGTDVAKAKELLDILTAVDTAAREAAAGMAASFGTVGQAIGGLTTALTGYSKTQAAIAAQLAAATKDAGPDTTKIAKANAAAQQQSAQAQMKSYGDMAGAAKGFFKENTAGYRALEGAEKAYRAVEMAMAVQAMVKKLFAVEAVTAATVTGEAVKSTAVVAGTATQVAADGVKGASAAAVAVATQAQGDPYTAWGRMAAMVAVMAALGFAVAGGGGGGDTTAKDRQAKQGTGSVLGDESAKSESINRSIENLEKYASIELSHTRDMLSALVKIRDTIGVVAAMATQTAGLRATALDEKKYGVGSSSGFLGIGASSTSIQDSGIKLNGSQTIGSAISSGVDASGYADITKKNSGLWGLFSSSKTSRDTIALDDDLKKQFGLLVGSMRDGAIEAVKLLGVSTDGILEKINGMALGINEISFKDMTGAEIEKELEAVFSKVGDDIAKLAVPELAQFQQVGEGYLETLTRVATNYATLDSILASSGVTFGAVGLSSIAARENFIKLAGGLDAFMEGTQSFNDNFLTEAEQLAPVQKYVTEQLAAMGLQGIDTRDKFKETVLGLASSGALATEAGAKQYTGLLALADAFAKTHEATEDLTLSQKEIADQRKDLQNQLDELTMTPKQLQEKEGKGIDPTNKALWDRVQAELALDKAAEDTATRLGIEAQIHEITGNKAAAAAVLEQQHAAALIGLTPEIAAATKELWAQQAAQKAAAVQTAENNSMWSSMAALAATTGDKLSASIVAKWQFEDSIKDLSPVAKDWAILANNAKIKQQLANEANEEYSKLLGYQAAQYAATGDTAAAAVVAQKQFELSIKDLSPALKAAAAAAREAEAAAKALGSQKSIHASVATEDMKVIEAQAALEKGFAALKLSVPQTVAEFLALSDGASTTTKAGRDLIAALELLAPSFNVVQTAAEKAAKEAAEQSEKDAKAYEEAREKAAEKNKQDAATLLELQGQYYEITGNKAGAAAVLELQHAAALLEMTPALQAASRAVWAATAAAEAQAKQLEKLKTAANDAFAVLGKAIDAEKTAAKAALDTQVALLNAQKSSARAMLEAQVTAAQAALDVEEEKNSKVKALADGLKSTLDGMQLNGDSAGTRLAAQAQIEAALAQAKATGMLPDMDVIAQALKTVATPNENLFSTRADFERDYYKSVRDIAELNVLTEGQLGKSDSTIQLAKDQIKATQDAMEASDKRFDDLLTAAQDQYDGEVTRLDAMLAAAQAQLDVMNGTTIAVKSVEAALGTFNSTVLAAIAGVQAAAARDTVLAGGGTVPSTGAGGALPALPGLPGVPEVEAVSKVQQLIAVYQKYSSVKGNELYGGREIRAIGATELEIAQAKDLFIDGSHRNGLSRVPFDGYIAELHQDEEVLTAPEARARREGDGSAAVIAELRRQGAEMRAELASIRREVSRGADGSGKTAETLDNATKGRPLRVLEVES